MPAVKHIIPTILLLDDDHAFCRAVTALGAASGLARVLAVHTPDDAFATLRTLQVDAILVDHHLSDDGPSGPELLPLLSRCAPPGKTFLCSAAYHPRDATSHVIPKPIDRETLKKIVA